MLAQRAGQRALAAVEPEPDLQSAVASTSDTSAERDRLEKQLEEILQYQAKLHQLREQGENRLQQEQLKLSHLEQHTRRLEHELARLTIAAEQLKATEENQIVDREQAENELAGLQTLIKDTNRQLEELRTETAEKRSYAIVPYQGPNGTYRKPIYIECRNDGIVIHPEGIEFLPADFVARKWSGNPLAAVLRATREFVNARAVAVGEPEPPDPYPVLLIRPDGLKQYSLARSAITAWDSDYGYEFIEADWKLDFPELADPRLARVQEHAKMIARERLVRLIRSAPSRFGGMGVGGVGSGLSREQAGSDGWGTGNSSDTAGELGALAQTGSRGSHQSRGSFRAETESSGKNTGSSDPTGNGGTTANVDEGRYADETSADIDSLAAGGLGGEQETGPASQYNDAANDTGGIGSDLYTQSQPSSGKPMSQGAAGSCEDCSGAATSAQQGASSSGASSPSSNQQATIAQSRGKNWAVNSGGIGAVPIRRPIQVVLRRDRLALLPSRHAMGGTAASGRGISLNQPVEQISDEFVAALRERIGEWGLAGNGLFWRPVLEMKVGPDAQRTASNVMRLLKDSGVEIRLPDTAQGERTNATR